MIAESINTCESIDAARLVRGTSPELGLILLPLLPDYIERIYTRLMARLTVISFRLGIVR